MTGITIVNFTHDLWPEDREQIERLTGRKIAVVKDVDTDFDQERSLNEESQRLLQEVEPFLNAPNLIVNLPSFSAGAAAVLARLHGYLGHFPRIIHFRESDDTPSGYEVAEILDLRKLRIRRAALGRQPGVNGAAKSKGDNSCG